MKRSLALLLASLLVVFGLTACGNDKKQDQGNQDSAVSGRRYRWKQRQHRQRRPDR